MHLLLCLSLLCPPASGGHAEVPYAWVAADAQWLVHLDLQGAVASTLVAGLGELPWQTELPTELRGRLGLDLRTDVHAITAYGRQDRPETFVLLARGESALDAALEKLALLVPHTREEIEGVPIDCWEAEEGEDPFYTYLARHAGTEERVLVLGLAAASVRSGLATLQGQAAHLEASQAQAAGDPSPGAFLFIVARDGLAAFAEHDPSSQVAQLVQSMVLEAGEHEAQAFLQVSVGTNNAADAQQIVQVLQGATALLSLVAQSEEDARPLQPLLQGISVQNQGARVTVRVQHASAGLVQMLQGELAKREALALPPPAPGQDGWY